MSLLNTLRVSQRLYGVVAVLGLSFAAAAVISNGHLDDIVAKAESTAEQRVPQLTQMAQLELDVTGVSLPLRHAMLSRSPE